jgi:hypothetical protein
MGEKKFISGEKKLTHVLRDVLGVSKKNSCKSESDHYTYRNFSEKLFLSMLPPTFTYIMFFQNFEMGLNKISKWTKNDRGKKKS